MKEVVARCPLCDAPMDPQRTAGVFGRMAPGEDVSALAGKRVDIDLSGFSIAAIVASPDAPIREQGFEVLFLVCSADCAGAIRIGAGLDFLDATGVLPDPQAAGVSGLRQFHHGVGLTPRAIERIARFEELLRTIAPAVAKRLRSD